MERGMERETQVKCGPRAIITCTVRAGRLYSLDWTGLTQKSVFQCRTEAKHTYVFTKVACIACFRVFPRVGRGQRSRAYFCPTLKKDFWVSPVMIVRGPHFTSIPRSIPRSGFHSYPKGGGGVWYSCIQKAIMGYSLHEDS